MQGPEPVRNQTPSSPTALFYVRAHARDFLCSLNVGDKSPCEPSKARVALSLTVPTTAHAQKQAAKGCLQAVCVPFGCIFMGHKRN